MFHAIAEQTTTQVNTSVSSWDIALKKHIQARLPAHQHAHLLEWQGALSQGTGETHEEASGRARARWVGPSARLARPDTKLIQH